MKNLADLDVQLACRDLFDQLLKRRLHEVFRFASVGGQADCGGDRLHRPSAALRSWTCKRHWQNEELHAYIQKFIANQLHKSELNEDAWDTAFIGRPKDTKSGKIA